MKRLRLEGLLLFALGLVLLIIWFYEAHFNREVFLNQKSFVDMIVLALTGVALFGAGLSLIKSSRTKQNPSQNIPSPP